MLKPWSRPPSSASSLWSDRRRTPRVLENQLLRPAAKSEGKSRGEKHDRLHHRTHQLLILRRQAGLAWLDLRVPEGSIFGFLGRNGAGKTTTIKTLMGLLRADTGTAEVFGIPVSDADRSIEVRRRIGFVTEDKELYPYMTVEQIIASPARSSQMARGFREALPRNFRPSRKIPDLSKGMRSKLMLLLAICRGAELLILDEPTDGLDPVATEDVCANGRHLRIGEHDVLLLPPAFRGRLIADHIGIIDRAR